MNDKSRSPAKNQRGRAAARLAAVQALYQHDMEETPEARLLDEFHQHRLGGEIDPELDGEQYVAAEDNDRLAPVHERHMSGRMPWDVEDIEIDSSIVNGLSLPDQAVCLRTRNRHAEWGAQVGVGEAAAVHLQ